MKLIFALQLSETKSDPVILIIHEGSDLIYLSARWADVDRLSRQGWLLVLDLATPADGV